MSMHTIDMDFDGWSMTVELDCIHEGDREVRATFHDPGCPATGPEFIVNTVEIAGAVHGCPMPHSFVEDIGQTEALRSLLIVALEEAGEADAADKWAREKQDELDAEGWR